MKKESAFKLKSGNKPSMAKMFGMMKTFKKNMQTAKDNRSKRDMSKAPKAMQNLNKAIGDALGSTGNLRKKISDKITSKNAIHHLAMAHACSVLSTESRDIICISV